MQRTISAMVGKGSVNHNSRKFKAENVNGERSHLNIDYCNENIKDIYHQLFDEALKKYNAKQTRNDRKIDDYYEKIRSSKQEKPFHELILQIGDRETMNSESENGEMAKQILDEYFQDFQERNPQLRVFSAHLHMDEATPHLHIDFVPFTTGSKRGLETRVSLKQALSMQGFKGGSRGSTEWSQWVQAEKEQLAAVMERHGIQWEQKGTHEQHLSVLDYKKQEREIEVEQLDSKIEQKKTEYNVLSKRIENYDEGLEELTVLEKELVSGEKYMLPEPQGFMTVKTYRTKIAEPLVEKLKSMLKTVLVRAFEGWDNYYRLNMKNGSLYQENQELNRANKELTEENARLRSENKDYSLLRKVFGRKQIDDLVEQAKHVKGIKRDNTRLR
ncbi:MAG: plasmid recombination protein [Clostridiales bacterium]|nr:plasmid recombination protein [Clostridiales bacterium]